MKGRGWLNPFVYKGYMGRYPVVRYHRTLTNPLINKNTYLARRAGPTLPFWPRHAASRLSVRASPWIAPAPPLKCFLAALPACSFCHSPPFAPINKGLLLMEFYSGATRLSGRFNEGLLLRRSQLITSAKNQVVLCRQHGLLRAVGSLAAR